MGLGDLAAFELSRRGAIADRNGAGAMFPEAIFAGARRLDLIEDARRLAPWFRKPTWGDLIPTGW